MKCEKCGAQTPENATFCPECGANLAEQTKKRTCPFCGNEVSEEAVFCNNCGERVDGKNSCKNCGAVFEGSFCPLCGTKAKQKLSEKTAEVKEEKAKTSSASPLKIVENDAFAGEKLKKIVSFITPILSLAAIALLLIFSFFIGVKYNVSASGFSQKELESLLSNYAINPEESVTVFDFFGECYQAFTEPTFWQIFPLIVCTVAVSVNLLAAAGAFAYSVYAVIRANLNKTTVNLAKPFAIAIATYIVAMLVMRSVLGVDLSILVVYLSSNNTIAAYSSLGVPAIVGAAVAAFVFIFSYALNAACSPEVFADKKVAVRTIVYAASLVFVLVAAVIAACGTYSVTTKELDSDGIMQSSLTAGETFSALIMSLETLASSGVQPEIDYGAAPFIGYFGMLIMIVAAAIAVACMVVSVGKNKAGYASVLACGGAVTGGFMTVISCFVCSNAYVSHMKEQLGDAFGKTTVVSTGFASFIVAAALLLVAFVLSIVALTLKKQKDEKVVIVSGNAVKF